jgi:hypothetical protein
MNDRSGYVFQNKQGAWYARTTITDATGKRRNIKRRAKDKRDAKEILKRIMHQLEEEGSLSLGYENIGATRDQPPRHDFEITG